MTELHNDHLRSRIDSLVEIAQNGQQAAAGIVGEERATHAGGLDRLEEVMGFTAFVLQRTDGVLVSEQTFQSLNSALVKVQDQIDLHEPTGGRQLR